VNAPPGGINVTCSASARFVTVFQPSTSVNLGLCQVQVWVALSPPPPAAPPPPPPSMALNLTTCGAVGPFGPSLASCTAAYSATAWATAPGVAYSFGKPAGASVDAWQVLTLAGAGTYAITAAGASNGVLAPAGSLNGGAPCRGAVVTTTLALPSNTSLYVIVGQAGTCDGSARACSSGSGKTGGGGGTFVLLANGSALVVAGGGGGWYSPPSGSWAQCDAQLSSSSGGAGHGANGDSLGGVAGLAGSAAAGTPSYAYGGAGLLADAVSPGDTANTPPKSALNGGTGSYYAPDWTQGDRNGGFGGGGFSGGGGGYSGGGGSVSVSSWISGGGGSYCLQGLANCVANSYNLGDGYVTISRVSSPLPSPPPPTSTTQYANYPQPGSITSFHTPAGFSQASQTWFNAVTGSTSNASTSAVTLASNSGDGSCASFSFLTGSTTSTIAFQPSFAGAPYSVCVVSKYLVGGTSNGRILQSRTGSTNWLLGHWGGNAGVSTFVDSANTQSNDYHSGVVVPRTNWVYSCAAVPSSGTVRVNVNGQDYSGAQDYSTAGTPGQLGVNLGGYAGEGSNFGIAALITWNSALSLTELAAASALLATSYSLQSGTCAPPSPPPPLPPPAVGVVASCAVAPGDGVYTVQPSGAGSSSFAAYCMGGFALLAKVDGTQTTWQYWSDLWTQASSTLNPGSLSLDRTEAKLAAFGAMPVSTLRLVFADTYGNRSLDVPLSGAAASLQSRFTSISCYPNPVDINNCNAFSGCNPYAFCSSTFIPTTLGRAAWLGLAGPGTVGLESEDCAEGINNQDGACVVARIGIRANDSGGCACTDSAIGFGMYDTHGSAGGINFGAQQRVFGYILGQ
jgi:hypothetical protein